MSSQKSNASPDDIKKLLVVLSGSRTGSSFLFQSLKSAGEFIAPTGEDTPFFRKAGLGVFDGSKYDDSVGDLEPERLKEAAELLLQDVGMVQDFNQDQDQLRQQFLLRFSLQFPQYASANYAATLSESLADILKKTPDWAKSWGDFYYSWLLALREKGIPLSLDLFRSDGRHPTDLPLCEEPPYVLVESKRALDVETARAKTLLLKTSTNLYRLPWLRSTFPKAEIKFVALRRNPVATISALMDGWLSSAFHSHDVSSAGPLKIGGYSDLVPGGNRYWKFDMPPQWQNYVNSKLDDVCAFQYLSAQNKISEIMNSEEQKNVMSVLYEDLLDPESLNNKLQNICRFAGVEFKTSTAHANDVMTVSSPRPGKWKKREIEMRLLMKKFNHRALEKCAEEIGYKTAEMELWP